MLSAHALVIAAVFVPYLVLMAGLGVYIWRTGRPRSDDPPDSGGEDDRDPGPAAVPLPA